MKYLLGILLLSAILDARSVRPAITVETLAKTSESWDGAALPSYPAGKPEVSILRITIPAHTRIETHMHPVINAGYLISGELTVTTLSGKTVHLHPSEALVETVDTWHYGENTSDDPAVIIVFYAGKPGVPLTVKKER